MKTLPNKLAYRKGMEISEGIILNELQSDKVTNLGLKTFSELEAINKQKETNGIANPLSPAEKVYLNNDEDTLKISYKIRFNGINSSPEIVLNDVFYDYFTNNIKRLKEENPDVIVNLAEAYAYNIVIGLVGFRNRDNSHDIRTTVKAKLYMDKEGEYDIEEETLNFDDQNYRMFSKGPFGKTLKNRQKIDKIKTENFEKLVEYIAKALKAEHNDLLMLEIDVLNEFKIGKGALIYPSELFTDREEKEYYKSLSYKKERYALTPEKIGNAIRTIDSFFKSDVINVTPVEPNGGNLRLGVALRGRGDDLYSILKRLEEPLTKEEIFFLLANINRGGLFQQN